LRENNYNTGLRGVLFEAKHYVRMGSAVWLYDWQCFKTCMAAVEEEISTVDQVWDISALFNDPEKGPRPGN
jgi:hypothetical protein